LFTLYFLFAVLFNLVNLVLFSFVKINYRASLLLHASQGFFNCKCITVNANVGLFFYTEI